MCFPKHQWVQQDDWRREVEAAIAKRTSVKSTGPMGMSRGWKLTPSTVEYMKYLGRAAGLVSSRQQLFVLFPCISRFPSALSFGCSCPLCSRST